MMNYITITEIIRNELLNNYTQLKDDFFKGLKGENINEEEIDFKFEEEFDDIEEILDYGEEDFYEFDDDIANDELIDNEDDQFEIQVFGTLIKKINSHQYKNLIYLVLLEDVFEYIKSKEIADIELLKYEKLMLDFLQNWDIKNLFSKLKDSYDFYLYLLTLYYEYHFENNLENRIKNRKLIELSNNQHFLEKFDIYKIDDIQYQKIKRRN